jgi:tRNA U34 5-methylaminomethyl-2-thiouridine-forming methyltransferase MnmC
LGVKLVQTGDGSFTYWNDRYRQCYHSVKEGAIAESYFKHCKPGFEWGEQNRFWGGKVRILDICFGLGYNSWVTLLHRPPGVRIEIISPELDRELVKSLVTFPYPSQFTPLRPVIEAVAERGSYSDGEFSIKVEFGRAEEIIPHLPDNYFHLIYQDPFSEKSNPELWSEEFLAQLSRLLHPTGMATTYATARKIRERLRKVGFYLYRHPYPEVKRGTIFSKLPSLPFPAVTVPTGVSGEKVSKGER